MNTALALSVIIPAFNEEKTIKKVILDANKYARKITDRYEILVLNDGSKDKTKEILKTINIAKLHVISHKQNMGIEASLSELYRKAKYKYCFFNGADGDIDMRIMINMARLLKVKDLDIVVGNRVEKNYTFKRKIISRSYNFLTRILTGVEVYDAGTVKLVNKKYIDFNQIHSKSVFAEAERLVLSSYHGAKIAPINLMQNKNEMNDKISLKQLFHCTFDLINLSFRLFPYRFCIKCFHKN